MQRSLRLICLLVITLSLSACAYIDTRSPYDSNLDNTGLGSKVGRSSNHSVLWLVAWGDASYAAAARDGNISVLKHSDVEFYNLLFGLYARRTIIVYGD